MERFSAGSVQSDESRDAVAAEPAESALNPADRAIFKKIDDLALLTKEPNWDDERGLAIGRGEWNRAWEFYLRLRKRGIQPPFIAPCGDGSIHFDWTSESGESLNIEIKDGNFWSATRDRDNKRKDEKWSSVAELESRVIQYFLNYAAVG